MDTFRGNLQLAALGDLDGLDGLVARLGGRVLNLLHDVVALEDLAEDDVTTIEPTGIRVLANVLRCKRSLPYLSCRRCFATYEVTTVVIKNWEPLVSLPALAMERTPFLVCLSLKFSSSNFSP